MAETNRNLLPDAFSFLVQESYNKHYSNVSFFVVIYISACGRTLQESIDKFSYTPTPGQSATCQWRISATHGEKIVLNLTELDIPESYQCEKHYLEVRDGHFIMSPLLGKVNKGQG